MNKRKLFYCCNKLLFMITILLLLALCVFGCGHNVLTISKGVGLEAVFSGDNTMPTVRVGEWDALSYVPRGNTSMSWSTATGGILGTGGTSQTLTITTGTQLNEGNITKILTSPECDEGTKLAVAAILPKIINDPVKGTDISSKTTYAIGGVGPNSHAAKPESTGTDKIVDKIAENADQIKDVANTAVTTTGNVINNTVDNAGNVTIAGITFAKWTIFILGIAVAVIIAGLVFLLIKIIPIISTHIFKDKKVKVNSVIGSVDVTKDENSQQN